MHATQPTQAPVEDITEERFKEREQSLRSIDLTNVYETDDQTDHKGEAACAGGSCQII